MDTKTVKMLAGNRLNLKMILVEAQYVSSLGTDISRMPGHCCSTFLGWALENNMKRKFYCCLLATQAAFLKLQ